MPKHQKSAAQIAKMQARSAARMDAQGRTKLTHEQAQIATGVAKHKSTSHYVPPINQQEKAQRSALRSEQKKERLDLIQEQVRARKA